MDPPLPHQPSHMAAAVNDPRIGVHMLTEFVFCPRAGLITYESQAEDDPHQDDDPRLDFLPEFNLAEIERRLQKEMTWLWRYWALLAALVVLAVLIALWSLLPGLIVALVALLHWITLVQTTTDYVALLAQRRQQAISAQADEPDPESDQPAPANWWSLVAAGFESIPYKDNLCDERWRLAGRPWRVLRRGPLRIPVFRLSRTTPPDLRKQHFVRISAYCHLLTVCEGAESPYGLVLCSDIYDGFAIPNSPQSRKVFHEALLNARRTIHQSHQSDTDPPPPEGESNPCRYCHLGRPRRLGDQPPAQIQVRAPTCPVEDRHGQPFHSPCGDRFRWIPPHQTASAKGLV